MQHRGSDKHKDTDTLSKVKDTARNARDGTQNSKAPPPQRVGRTSSDAAQVGDRMHDAPGAVVVMEAMVYTLRMCSATAARSLEWTYLGYTEEPRHCVCFQPKSYCKLHG